MNPYLLANASAASFPLDWTSTAQLLVMDEKTSPLPRLQARKKNTLSSSPFPIATYISCPAGQLSRLCACVRPPLLRSKWNCCRYLVCKSWKTKMWLVHFYWHSTTDTGRSCDVTTWNTWRPPQPFCSPQFFAMHQFIVPPSPPNPNIHCALHTELSSYT